MSSATPPPLGTGRKLAGKFEILGVLGEGATGIVYDVKRVDEGDRIALRQARHSLNRYLLPGK